MSCIRQPGATQYCTEAAALAERVAELEARILDLEGAIRYCTYLDYDGMAVYVGMNPDVDLADKVPLLRDVHTKHPMKVA